MPSPLGLDTTMTVRILILAAVFTGLQGCEPAPPRIDVAQNHPANVNAKSGRHTPAPRALTPELQTATPKIVGGKAR